AAHHEREVKLRDEQLSLVRRMTSTTKTRVESGRGLQAELLEMDAEVAMSENEREHAVTALARSRAELNTLLARDPAAPIAILSHEHLVPPTDAAPVE